MRCHICPSATYSWLHTSLGGLQEGATPRSSPSERGRRFRCQLHLCLLVMLVKLILLTSGCSPPACRDSSGSWITCTAGLESGLSRSREPTRQKWERPLEEEEIYFFFFFFFTLKIIKICLFISYISFLQLLFSYHSQPVRCCFIAAMGIIPLTTPPCNCSC